MNRYDAEKQFVVSVDRDNIKGIIKPLHGVNNAPYYYGDAERMHYLKEAHIPYSRLHDTCGPYGGNRYVDIENIFRDFDADETDPANYDFTATDHLLTNLSANGTEPFYRLGCTIENDPFGIGYRIFPPKDQAKWARICEHIIAHYNEGWGNGLRLGITYWELWNEPDNEPDVSINPMWRGTMHEFFELYRVAANHLKARFPALKIGGYGSCGFYSVVQREAAPDAKISPRTAYFTDFFLQFLDYISAPETRAPLDFFSWHSYADENSCVRFAEFARRQLDIHGFTGTESIFNEWNTGVALRGTAQDASNIASMMITMHDSSTDKMMYYDAQYIHSYSGLFSSDTKEPLPAYYAFKAFGELYNDGEAAEVNIQDVSGRRAVPEAGGNADVNAAANAAVNVSSPVPAAFPAALKALASRSHLLVVNRLSKPVYVTVNISGKTETPPSKLRIIDGSHSLSDVNWDGMHFPLPPFGIALISY